MPPRRQKKKRQLEDDDDHPQPIASSTNACGYKGVSKSGHKWQAQISDGHGKMLYLGMFDTVTSAARAYAKAFSGGGQVIRAELAHKREREVKTTEGFVLAGQAIISTSNATGFVGVHRHNNTFVAKIRDADGKQVHLGTFQQAEDAGKAYARAYSMDADTVRQEILVNLAADQGHKPDAKKRKHRTTSH